MGLPSTKELDHAAQELHDHEHGTKLADVAAGVILDHAAQQYRSSAGEPGLAKQLEEESELDAEARATALGDPFELLERGPKSAGEAALLALLLAKGVTHRLERADGEEEQAEVAAALLEQLDWIAATTGLAPYRALGATLDGKLAEVFWTATANDLVEVSSAPEPDDPVAAARRQTRLLFRANALAEAPKKIRAEMATSVLGEIRNSNFKRVALSALAGLDDAEAESQKDQGKKPSVAVRAASAARAPRLEGGLEGQPWGPVTRLLATITGILLLRWLLRLAGRYLLGLKREGTLSLSATTVGMDRKIRLLGRVIREDTTALSLRSLRDAAIERRYPFAHLVAGALALIFGATLGVNYLIEGVMASYPALALFGVVVIIAGVGLDVLLEVLLPNRKGATTVALDFGRRKIYRLRGVKEEQAIAFVRELELLVPPPTKRK